MRYLTSILKLIFFLALLLISGLGVYTYTSGDEIKQFLVREINEQLLVETEVREVDISLLQNFPNLSLILQDVHMHQTDRSLIKARELRIKFSLADLLDKNFELQSIVLKNGQLNLVEDQEGRYFPKIWKKTSFADEADALQFQLKLNEVELHQMRVHYRQGNGSIVADILIDKAGAAGNFMGDRFSLFWDSRIDSLRLIKNNRSLLNEADLNLRAKAKVYQANQSIDFSEIKLRWKGLDLNAKGNLNYAGGLKTQLSISPEKNDLKQWLPLLPSRISSGLDSLGATAELRLKGQLEGELSPLFRPTLSVDILLEKGRMNLPEGPSFQNIWLKGSFNSLNLATNANASLTIDSLRSEIDGQEFTGKLFLADLKNPILELEGAVKLKLASLNSYLRESGIQFEKGMAKLEMDLNLPIYGEKQSWLHRWKSGENSILAEIKAAEVSLKIDGEDRNIKRLNTHIALGSNDLYAKDLSFIYDEIELDFEGQFLNLISYSQAGNETLIIDGEVASPALSIEHLIASIRGLSAEGKGENEIRFYLKGNVNKMSYEHLEMTSVQFQLRYANDKLQLNNISLHSLGGKANGSFELDRRTGQSQFKSNGELDNIDIHGLFEAFDNFGQEHLKADNINGIAHSNFQLKGSLNDSGDIASESILLNALIEIEEGRLINYEPLYRLSRFIEVEELQEVKFDRLLNQIKIENEEVFIPRFDIHSSAIDLQLEGTHSFDNQVDYHIKIGLDQILGKKARKPKQSEFGYVEDDGLGKTQLFLSMKGPLDDPLIKYDSRQLKDHLKSEVAREKQEIKSILKAEFGLFKKDSSLKEPNQKETKRSLFQIEWDEEKKERREHNSSEAIDMKAKKSSKKSKFGKFIDKIAKPNEDEYVYPD